ncbi:MAG: gliding motility-associated ABC transporter substrate-binding protein GldG [Bacteroidetes bacterium]|nr:gliding motility-associated ABC transporter substrate-binding protein GldG [Bacteroidota bacterium]
MVKNMSSRSKKANTITQLVLVVALIAIVNLLGQFIYTRLDLTLDQRFTLSDITKLQLEQLEGTIYAEVYLEGDELEPGFKKLRDATRDMLNEFNILTDGMVQFAFINPDEQADGEDKYNYFQQLQQQGLNYTEVSDFSGTELKRKIIWPCALIKYGEKSVPVQLLMNQLGGQDPSMVLHNSIMRLEYELVAAIKRATGKSKPRVAIVAGHGELSTEQTQEFLADLKVNYDVERMSLPHYKPGKLEEYDLAIVAKPDSNFSDVDLYKLDQYIMNGGKVLWLLDALHIHLDSLRKNPWTVSDKYPLKNLRGLLYNYGVRLNENFVQDYNSHSIPIKMGKDGQVDERRKWPFYPILIPQEQHPITKGVGPVWARFASTLDTVRKPGISKIPLLITSPNSKVLPHPVRIDLQMTSFNFEPSHFNQPSQTVALLLEGAFTSDFKNRLQPETLENKDFSNFKSNGEPTKQIVISDGDMAYGNTNGYFDNKAFLMNCVDYLIDNSKVFSLRAKNYRLRMLNIAKAKEEKSFWTIVNLSLPITIVILFGLFFNYLRKRRYK